MCLRMLALAPPNDIAPSFFTGLTLLVSAAWLALGVACQSPTDLPFSCFELGAADRRCLPHPSSRPRPARAAKNTYLTVTLLPLM